MPAEVTALTLVDTEVIIYVSYFVFIKPVHSCLRYQDGSQPLY